MNKLVLSLMLLVSYMLAAINLNTATKEELMSLKGIGSSKAEAIIEYRKANKFKSTEELKNVKGIGDSIYKKLEKEISVSNTKNK
ncbi:putative ComE family competence protein [Campylobacter pinnipediorum subsp. caledonicus]|uniref:Putative ComE family competence protein n=1 Tax=Campylobacter pinnipediorum subsp. caledonicus TaxID=1874362 RepID=A0A1S6U5T6_9BACT|nr:helix-hairpin-helix domain-containing protein [Campylobacter pinnipediorum]AQW85445.1 putative ComE family competence protein [Campylobacter pinnipediorum subsp. caledonicus]AQW87052.1 putative ComE family competence protein [Campylobacter pinnipediorum subsp. caledonicus]